MSSTSKVMIKVLSGRADRNISFSALCALLSALGFEKRTKGDHHIYTRYDVEEIVNIQPRGGDAKPYQVRQVRNLIVKYKLGLGGNDE